LKKQGQRLEKDNPAKAAAKLREARTIWRAVENRYRNDPSAGPILRELRRDRGQ
jgi:hypothetical protein